MGAHCTKIDNLKDAFTSWYSKHEKLLKAKGMTDPLMIDNALMSVWNSKLLSKDADGILKYVVDNTKNNITTMYIDKSPVLVKIIAVRKDGPAEYTVATNKGTYTFKNGSADSTSTAGITSVTLPLLANVHLESTDNQLNNKNEAKAEELFEKVKGDIFNDPKKALNLFKTLADTDVVAINDKHKAALEEIVSTLTDPLSAFIPKLNVFINNQAEENGGVFTMKPSVSEIVINKTNTPSKKFINMSSAEAFVHELVHASTSFAIRTNRAEIASTVRRLKTLRKQVMPKITPEVLLPKVSLNDKVALEEAEKFIDRMHGNLEEFIAIAATNENIQKILKSTNAYEKSQKSKSLWKAFTGLIKDILNSLFRLSRKESFNIDNNELLQKLILELAEANNAANVAAHENIISKLLNKSEILDDFGSKLLSAVEKTVSKKSKAAMPQNLSKIDEGVWLIKNLSQFLFNPNTREGFELALSSLGMRQFGTIQTLFRNLRDNDSLQNVLEKVNLIRGTIDRDRRRISSSVSSLIVKGFNKTLTKDEFKAVTLAALDTDLSSIYQNYSTKEMQTLLSNSDKLSEELTHKRKELATIVDNKSVSNYFIAQADALGRFMATGVPSIALAYNAYTIGNTFESSVQSDNTIKLIDELATLEALHYTSDSAKKVLNDLIKTEKTGIDNVIGLHKSFTESSKNALFKDSDMHHYIKGYTRQIFDDSISIKVAAVTDKKLMEDSGYTIKKILKPAAVAKYQAPLALYVSKTRVVQKYNSKGIQLTDLNRKGGSLSNVAIEGNADLSQIKIKNMKIAANKVAQANIIKMMKGEYYLEKDNNLAPVYDTTGKIVDYRYMMSKADKEEILNQDYNAALIMGKSIASITDKVKSTEFNKVVLGIIRDDMKKNYDSTTLLGRINKKLYIDISDTSTNKDVREIYKILPKVVKDDIAINGPIAVREDLLYAYFGFRDYSVADSFFFKMTPTQIKEAVRLAEFWWKEAIKTHKVDIVIRTPQVLLNNCISNVMLPVLRGELNVASILRLQWSGFRELRQYQKDMYELLKLRAAKKSGNALKLDLKKISQLENNIELSAVKDLMDEGLFQPIVEELSIGDIETGSKLTEKRNILFDRLNAPTWVRSGADVLWVTEKTKFFKAMTAATQYSDFVARYAHYHLLVKRAQKKYLRENNEILKGDDLIKAKKKAIIEVRDAYINYDMPSSKSIKYLNDIGLVMFTTYTERIQKVIRKSATDKPASVIISLLTQQILDMDIEDISDQSLLSKEWGGLFHPNPLEHLESVITPTLAEYIVDAYKLAAK